MTGFGIGNLQRIQSIRFRLRIVRAVAQDVGLLCGKPRPQFRIPNSEFRIHFGFGSFAPRRMVSDCRAEARDLHSEFRIPNSEWKLLQFALCKLQNLPDVAAGKIVSVFYSAVVSAALRLALSSSRMRVCSLSVSAYFHVGIAASSIPIAGGMEIKKNMAAANLPSL